MSELLNSIITHTNTINAEITSHGKMFYEIYNFRIRNTPLREYHYSYINCWESIDSTDFWLYLNYIIHMKTCKINRSKILKMLIANLTNKLENTIIGMNFVEFCRTIKFSSNYGNNFCIHFIIDIFYHLIEKGYNVKSGKICKMNESCILLKKEWKFLFECNQVLVREIKEFIKSN
jgi:hypothetical protein